MALSAEVAGGEGLPDLHRIRWALSVRPTTAKEPLGSGRKQAKQLKLPAPGEDGVVPLQMEQRRREDRPRCLLEQLWLHEATIHRSVLFETKLANHKATQAPTQVSRQRQPKPRAHRHSVIAKPPPVDEPLPVKHVHNRSPVRDHAIDDCLDALLRYQRLIDRSRDRSRHAITVVRAIDRDRSHAGRPSKPTTQANDLIASLVPAPPMSQQHQCGSQWPGYFRPPEQRGDRTASGPDRESPLDTPAVDVFVVFPREVQRHAPDRPRLPRRQRHRSSWRPFRRLLAARRGLLLRATSNIGAWRPGHSRTFASGALAADADRSAAASVARGARLGFRLRAAVRVLFRRGGC